MSHLNINHASLNKYSPFLARNETFSKKKTLTLNLLASKTNGSDLALKVIGLLSTLVSQDASSMQGW